MQNGQNSCMYRLSAPKDLSARDLLSSLLVLVDRFLLFLSRYFLAMVDLDLCTKLKISSLIRKPVNNNGVTGYHFWEEAFHSSDVSDRTSSTLSLLPCFQLYGHWCAKNR